MCFVGNILSVFFLCYGDHRELHVLTHSFPTRRSSDLAEKVGLKFAHNASAHSTGGALRKVGKETLAKAAPVEEEDGYAVRRGKPLNPTLAIGLMRSEEHTSELQSLMRISYAVFCLKTQNNVIWTPT